MATFTATGISSTRILLKFSSIMTDNAALVAASNYTLSYITSSVGSVTHYTDTIPISGVEKQSNVDPTSVVLVFGEPLESGTDYTVTIASAVLDTLSAQVLPSTSHFHWLEDRFDTQAAIGHFGVKSTQNLSGVDLSAILDGIYFSPALDQSGANSSLGVDDVDVCTIAHDVYKFPEFNDPRVLFTHAPGSSPQTNTIGKSTVLWAPWARLEEIRRSMSQALADVKSASTSPLATLDMQSVNPEHIALLNNVAWKTFDNLGTPPYYFIAANNVAPYPPGPHTKYIYNSTIPRAAIELTLTDWITSDELVDPLHTLGAGANDTSSVTDSLSVVQDAWRLTSDTLGSTESDTVTIETFVPTTLGDVILWLRPDLGVTLSGGEVTGWADQSGIGDSGRNFAPFGVDKPAFNATDAAYNNRPTIGTFNKAGVAANCRLVSGTWNATYSTFSIFVIGHAGTGNRYFVFEQDSDTIALSTQSGVPTVFSGGFSPTLTGGSMSTSLANLIGAEFNGTSSKFYANALSAATASGTLASSTLGNTSYKIGSYPGSAALFGVERIAEVLIFSRILTAPERATLRSYFNLRYGTSIS